MNKKDKKAYLADKGQKIVANYTKFFKKKPLKFFNHQVAISRVHIIANFAKKAISRQLPFVVILCQNAHFLW